MLSGELEYHRDIGFPPGVVWPLGVFCLRYTRHALQEAKRDRFGDFSGCLPDGLSTRDYEVVQATVRPDGRVSRMTVRTRLDGRFVLVLVVVPTWPRWTVVTVYLNRQSGDRHLPADLGRFAVP